MPSTGYELWHNTVTYPFTKIDTEAIIGGYLLVIDTGLAAVTTADTIFHTDTSFGIRNLCTGYINWMWYREHRDTVFGSVSFDSTHYRRIVRVVGVTDVFSSGEMQAYPNPATDHIIVTLPEGYTAWHVTMMNELGQTVFTQDVGRQATIGRNSLPAGTYMLIVQNGDALFRQKIIFE